MRWIFSYVLWFFQLPPSAGHNKGARTREVVIVLCRILFLIQLELQPTASRLQALTTYCIYRSTKIL